MTHERPPIHGMARFIEERLYRLGESVSIHNQTGELVEPINKVRLK